jgi:hypothetical protein
MGKVRVLAPPGHDWCHLAGPQALLLARRTDVIGSLACGAPCPVFGSAAHHLGLKRNLSQYQFGSA